MRVPWRRPFPPVFVHAAWDPARAEDGKPILPEHPGYWPAKKNRGFKQAINLYEDIIDDDVLNDMFDACHSDEDGTTPIVVAPSLNLEETQNVLAIGHAQWISHEMGWDIDKNIFHEKTIGRDFNTNGWFRLLHNPTFYGPVARGRRYVIADDVCTMGGTMAGLRGYIEASGGHVICMTALANGGGVHAPISLAEKTEYRLNEAFDGELAIDCRRILGYGIDCLTEQEGQFLLRCPSIDVLRAGFDGARYP